MNHPSHEEWMSYLYGELPLESKAACKSHLQGCPVCSENVAQWQSAMTSLEAWTLPAKPQTLTPGFLPPVLKWGLAALFALGLGFGLGRYSVPGGNAEALRAEIEASLQAAMQSEIRKQIPRHLGDEVKSQVAAAQAQLSDRMDSLAARTLAASSDQAQGLMSSFGDALNRLDAKLNRQAADLTLLRKDAETMAVLTEMEFRRNDEQWVQFANYNEPTHRFSAPSRDTNNP